MAQTASNPAGAGRDAPDLSAATGPLVVLNVLNYGHFNAHADNFVHWGLSRGLPVALVGRDPGRFPGRAVLAERAGLTLCDIETCCPGLDWDDPETARFALGKGWRELIAAVAARLRPRTVLLVNADEVFFHDQDVAEADAPLPVPVWGVVTFGRRPAHFGLDEPYTRRLDRTVATRRGFAGLLDIDEYHVAEADPEQRFLHYLPDPYREFFPFGPAGSDPETARDAADKAALRAFLAAAAGPVVPILGKCDHRKGNRLLLEAVVARPDLRVVVLGQRQPDPEDDAAIDAVLARLSAEGRAFVRFGFVPQALFDLVLGCGRVPCLPLPYRAHAGSSGLQLLGFEYGLPSLVPDFGLMAERVRDHGLGRLFAPGDAAAFGRALDAMLTEGNRYAPAIARFMAHFGVRAMADSLDRAVLGRHAAPDRLAPFLALRQPAAPWWRAAQAARAALGRRDLAGALDGLDAALAGHPDNPAALLLLRMAVAMRLGDTALAVSDAAACARAGLDAALRLFFILAMPEEPSGPEAANDATILTLDSLAAGALGPLILREHGATAFLLVHALMRRNWLDDAGVLLDRLLAVFPGEVAYRRSRGAVWARQGAYAQALDCFAKLARDGDADAWLNASDCLRYAGSFDEALRHLDEGWRRGACDEATVREKRARIEAARADVARKAQTAPPPCQP